MDFLTISKIKLTSAKMIFELRRLRMANDVVTVVKLSGEREFVTSDNPVSYFQENVRRPAPADPMNTMSIAIDSKHLLQSRPWANQLDKKMLGRMTEFDFMSDVIMTMHNKYQLHQSGMFMLGTRTGLMQFQINPDGILKGKYNLFTSTV
ncbi:MAG TPA: hypothetical protein VIH86_16520 [Puia sp.]